VFNENLFCIVCSIILAVKNVCVDMAALLQEPVPAAGPVQKKKTKSTDSTEPRALMVKATRPSFTQVSEPFIQWCIVNYYVDTRPSFTEVNEPCIQWCIVNYYVDTRPSFTEVNEPCILSKSPFVMNKSCGTVFQRQLGLLLKTCKW